MTIRGWPRQIIMFAHVCVGCFSPVTTSDQCDGRKEADLAKKYAASNHQGHVYPVQFVESNAALLRSVLSDQVLLEAFQKHLSTEHCLENLLFYKSATAWRKNYHTQSQLVRDQTARTIFTTYISVHSRSQINIRSDVRHELEVGLGKGKTDFPETLFDSAIQEIFNLMKTDCFQRFKKVNDLTRIAQTG
mmetsp:Transcript_22779/g.40388  ORF Transcript_22779/g.40388 Transcript_22779/m.40388 type:complete len:190 (-) Transcript_22779:130-699(-)